MAWYFGGIQRVLDTNQELPLLTNEDEERILNTGEFDYYLEPTQENKEESQLDDRMIDLILDNDEVNQNDEPEWKANSMKDFIDFLKEFESKSSTGEEEEQEGKEQKERDPDKCCAIACDNNKKDTLDNAFCSNSSTEDGYKDKKCEIGLKRELKEIQNDAKVKEIANDGNLQKKPKEETTKKGCCHKAKILLEDYLQQLLENDMYATYLHWTCKDKKEFKLTNARQVANLWGMEKGKGKFTADKLKREMRYLRNTGKLLKMDKIDHFQFL